MLSSSKAGLSIAFYAHLPLGALGQSNAWLLGFLVALSFAISIDLRFDQQVLPDMECFTYPSPTPENLLIGLGNYSVINFIQVLYKCFN